MSELLNPSSEGEFTFLTSPICVLLLASLSGEAFACCGVQNGVPTIVTVKRQLPSSYDVAIENAPWPLISYGAVTERIIANALTEQN
jgi:hypothetical protein